MPAISEIVSLETTNHSKAGELAHHMHILHVSVQKRKLNELV